MASSATLAIKVIADTKQAQAELGGASTRMGKFGSAMQKAAVPAGIALAGIVAFGKGALDAASNTQQAFGAVDSVFGKNSAVVKKWADDAATNVGLARADYGQLAALIGSQLKNAGVPMEKLAGLTDDLITKGADLASMFGGTTREAVEALSSGLKGEFDPLEKYGVTMNQTKLNAELAARGLDNLTGKAASQAKTMVLLDEVNKQTADSTGNFKKESDTAAGSAAIAAAKYTNLKDTLGQVLLPIVAKVTAVLATMAGWMEKHSKLTQILIGVLGGLAVAVLAVNAAMKVYEATMIVVGAVQKAVWLTNPIFLVIAAVIALVAAFVILYKKSKTFRDFINKLWAEIKRGAAAVTQFLAPDFKRAWAAISAAGKRAAQIIKSVFNALKPVFRVLGTIIKTYFKVAFELVKTYVKSLWATFKLAYGIIKGVIKATVAVFKGDWRGAFDAVKGILKAFKQFFVDIFHALPGPVQDILVRVKNALVGAFQAIRNKASGLGSAISAPFETLYDWVQRVIDAVEDLIGWIGRIDVPNINLPNIPGLGKAVGFSVTPAAQPSLARSVAPTTVTRAGVTGGPTIIVQGALDPEAVARQIKRILASHDRRVGVA